MENKKPPPYTIMIVEDDETDIDILMACLGDRYRVKVTLDGIAALQDIKQEPPDLILLDIIMPGLDGYEVCRLLKADDQTRAIPVLFVTGLTEAVDETRGFELGGVDYITKPFNFSVIRARIKTHLELAEARKKMARQNEILKENIRLREQVEQISRHDLKNPVQVIMGAAELMALCPDMPRQAVNDMLDKQLKACDIMLNLINRSMDLYMLENHSYNLDTRAIDILPVLDRALLGLNHLVAAKSLKIEVQINGRLRQTTDRFELMCEELLLYSMMSNLLKNALEASPTHACVSILFDAGALKTIRIENRGAVTPAIRDRFFEKFITSGKKKGTGLGTYSARMIAEIHGAGISMATSDEKDMTRIRIAWPP